MGELSGNNDALRLACVLSFCICFSYSFSLVWRRVFVFFVKIDLIVHYVRSFEKGKKGRGKKGGREKKGVAKK